MATNSLDSLDYTALPGGSIQIKIGLKHPLANPPAGFTINNPPRIALDLPETANNLGKNTVAIGQGILRSVNVVQSGKRTRLVLNLNKNAGYETSTEGNKILVTLKAAEVAGTTSNTTTRFAEEQPSASQHSLRAVDFRRGSNGDGRVVVDLSDTGTGIDIRQQGKNLVVDFMNTALPKSLERRLDVTDFGTPVQSIDTYSQGKNTRIVITPKGQWEHSAYQADRQFIVDIKPVVESPNKLTQGKKYTGEKLSLNFQNVEVRAVLQVIADFTGLNIITSDTVTGNLTLRLKDVPWDQALDIILQSKGLSMRKNGSVIWIAPTDELATKEKLELEAQQQISELEPTHTETFHLRYQKAENFVKLLTDPTQRILSKRGGAVIDPRTNTIFVNDTPSKLDEVRSLINQVDVAVKQVMIESRIVEASDTFGKNIGARLGYQDHGAIGSNEPGYGIGPGSRGTIAFGGQIEAPGYQTGQAADIPTFNQQGLKVNLPAANIGTSVAGALSMVLFKRGGTKFLNLELSALQADGKGKVISNPRVVTADQQEATIESGQEIPYAQATSSGATSIAFKKAVLSLKVKPQITPDDNVIMDITVHKDSPRTDLPVTGGIALDTKQITTQVLVENGGTVVIGGIYTQDQSNNVSKIPVLGDIPVVGVFFKNTTVQDNKTELLIFVTPKIMKDTLNIQ